MVIMFRMSASKKAKMLDKLEKMEEFIDDFKDCLENSEEDDDYEFREDGHEHEYGEKEFKKLMNRYAKMKRMGMK